MARQTKRETRPRISADEALIVIDGKERRVRRDRLPEEASRLSDAWAIDDNDQIEVDIEKAREVWVKQLYADARRERIELEIEEIRARVSGRPFKGAARLEELRSGAAIPVDELKAAATPADILKVSLRRAQRGRK
jgi:hypothetical protein